MQIAGRRACALVVSMLVLSAGGVAVAQQQQQTLRQAREGFRTKLIPNGYEADGPAEEPGAGNPYVKVKYPSAVGPLAAYLTADPKDGKRHPAIVWAHGGFGGIDGSYWQKQPASNDQTPKAFLDKGMVVMLPSWRGENENPGKFELFYGEIDDALAAVDYVAKLPYVDPTRIYLAGHSTGGTVTLLAALSTEKVRAAFSFGGSADVARVVSDGRGYGNTPFDIADRREGELRSAVRFISTLKTPTWYFEGAAASTVQDAMKADRIAQQARAPFHAFIVAGGNHFNILRPLTTLLAGKIAEDTGPTCRIKISAAEVKGAFDQSRAAVRAKLRGMPLATVTPAAAAAIQAVMAKQKLDPAKTYLRLGEGGIDLTEAVDASQDVTGASNGVKVVMSKADAVDYRGTTIDMTPEGKFRIVSGEDSE